MLTVLDPLTFRGSPRYEVPTRPHTIWCGSPIRYDGLISIVLRICLNSCLSAHESGSLCLREVRFAFLVSVSVTCVEGSFSVEGESESGFQVDWEQSQHCQEHTTQQDVHNFQRSSPHGCDSHNIQGDITHTTLTEQSK